MECVQALYLVVELLHSGVIPGLTFGLICGAGMEPRTLYILAMLFHWATPQPCGTTKLFSSQNPCFHCMQSGADMKGKFVKDCPVFPFVWTSSLGVRARAWAAQVLCREQDWRKVLLLSEASAHTLSLSSLSPSTSASLWTTGHLNSRSYPEDRAENDAPSTGLLGLPQQLCGKGAKAVQWRKARLWLCHTSGCIWKSWFSQFSSVNGNSTYLWLFQKIMLKKK